LPASRTPIVTVNKVFFFGFIFAQEELDGTLESGGDLV
jgi:hypothetical protein